MIYFTLVQGLVIIVGTAATITVVYKILDGFYENTIQAVARKNDKAGVIVLHHPCRWLMEPGMLPSQDSGSVEMELTPNPSRGSEPEEEALLNNKSDAGEIV